MAYFPARLSLHHPERKNANLSLYSPYIMFLNMKIKFKYSLDVYSITSIVDDDVVFFFVFFFFFAVPAVFLS